MNIQELRSTLATRTVVFSILVVIILIIYPADEGEIIDLVAILSPITAIYLGVLAQYIGNSIRSANVQEEVNSDEKEEEQKPLKKVPYASLIKWLVTSHFIIVIMVLLMKPFSILTFGETKIILVTIETLFGVYLGYIITAVFNVSES